MSKMKILFVASEAAPFIKTGGLADVAAALPKYLKRQGAEVKLVLPLYSLIDREKYQLRKMYDGSCVKMGNCEEWYSVYYAETPCHYDAYFIEFNKYFDRYGVYDDKNSHQEYQDNAYRYAFFCLPYTTLHRTDTQCLDLSWDSTNPNQCRLKYPTHPRDALEATNAIQHHPKVS